MKNLLWLWIVLAILVVGFLGYMLLPKSKKRYLAYISRQASSLIARYFV